MSTEVLTLATLAHILLKTQNLPFVLDVSNITLHSTLSDTDYRIVQLQGRLHQPTPASPLSFQLKAVTDDRTFQFNAATPDWRVQLSRNHPILKGSTSSIGLHLHESNLLSQLNIQTHLQTLFPQLPTALTATLEVSGSLSYTCLWPTVTSRSPTLFDLNCPLIAHLLLSTSPLQTFFEQHLTSGTEPLTNLFLPLYTHLMLTQLLPLLPANWHLVRVQPSFATPTLKLVHPLRLPPNLRSHYYSEPFGSVPGHMPLPTPCLFSAPHAHALLYVPPSTDFAWTTSSQTFSSYQPLFLHTLFADIHTNPHLQQLQHVLHRIQQTETNIQRTALSC